jgi:hypothetical protein
MGQAVITVQYHGRSIGNDAAKHPRILPTHCYPTFRALLMDRGWSLQFPFVSFL